MVTRQEKDANARFPYRYGEERGDVARAIELAVIGSDWGANGYTTFAQADHLAAMLELDPGLLVLDIGAGRGRILPGAAGRAITGQDPTSLLSPAVGLVALALYAAAAAIAGSIATVRRDFA